ncbi:MAG: response regulator transcription factor [Candidatus Gastranaerophilales bacterium]|nr:response regulator transcription factor [Candidatus Gastranaerophilales bacterium]
MDKIKIIIVEDHVLTRIGLKTALEESSKLEIIGEADYGETGVDLAKKIEPDVVLMDLGLPNMSGIEATRLIKEYNVNIKVLILTSHDEEKEIIGALKAGADAYCMKDINPMKLIPVIESIAQGGVWLDPVIAKIVITNSLNQTDAKKSNMSSSPLSAREIEILQLLTDGLNNLEIAAKLSLSQYTVKAHICNILQKLAVTDRTQAVVRAMRSGWIK